jgi:head-tail adaptor
MDAFAAAELRGMQATQVESLMDTCLLQVWSGDEADDYGQRVETWTDSEPLACGFNPKGGREVSGPDKEPIVTDASVRLPIDTTVHRNDRISITHRFGAALAEAQVFEVAAEPRRGPSGLQLDLRRVEL